MSIFSEKNIDAFITEGSLKIFSKFNNDDGFLKDDPTTWESNTDFTNAKNIVNSLTIINDTAERAVKLMEDFNETFPLKFFPFPKTVPLTVCARTSKTLS